MSLHSPCSKLWAIPDANFAYSIRFSWSTLRRGTCASLDEILALFNLLLRLIMSVDCESRSWKGLIIIQGAAFARSRPCRRRYESRTKVMIRNAFSVEFEEFILLTESDQSVQRRDHRQRNNTYRVHWQVYIPRWAHQTATISTLGTIRPYRTQSRNEKVLSKMNHPSLGNYINVLGYYPWGIPIHVGESQVTKHFCGRLDRKIKSYLRWERVPFEPK